MTLDVHTTFPPKEQGLYVAYVEGAYEKYPSKILLMWVGGVWGYPSSTENFRGTVYGYLGPLPTPTVRSLKRAATGKRFIIGEFIHNELRHHHGPFTSIKEALDIEGTMGYYIYTSTLNSDDHKIIRKWDPKELLWQKVRSK